MPKKKTLLIAAGLLATVGALAAVSAQGHRGHGRGGFPEFGGGDGLGLGSPEGGMRGRFAAPLTKDEFDSRTRERFARLDRNSDGVIDAAEIEASIAEQMSGSRQKMGGGPGMRPGAAMGERMIRMFDTNKDGKVTKDEFIAVIKTRFAEMDLNNDGRITDDDLPPMMRGRNVLAGGDVGGGGMGMGPGNRMGRGMGGGFPMLSWLRDTDANKDGVITLDEALAAAEKRFATADRNKDGAIDKADFDVLRKEMVDYRVKRFIHQFGADKEGKVTREQFVQKAQQRFAQMDVNGDGTIGRGELPGGGGWFGRGHGQGGPGGRMRGWMHGGDRDGEGGPMRGPGMGGAPGQQPDRAPGKN